MNSTIKVMMGNLVLLVVYYISAHFTLSLGLPPIGGTPVWVPAGISLGVILVWGYRFLPAVFLGDFIIGVELVGLDTTSSMLICILIGAQAAAHAGLTTWLLRRLMLWPNLLINTLEIIRFFSVSALTLLLITWIVVVIEWTLGALPATELLRSLFMWWAGGVIGVVLFTPLILILFAQPKKEWQSRFMSVALPLWLLFIITVAIIFYVQKSDQQTRAEIFNEKVTIAHQAIETELTKNNLLLHAMRAYFGNTTNVSSEQFRRYLHDLSSYQNSTSGVALVDYVLDQHRVDYEEKYGGEISELNSQNIQQTAEQRRDYFVIRYSQIAKGYAEKIDRVSNMNLFDLCFSPIRRAICQQAINSQQARILPPILENADKGKRFVSILPILGGSDEIHGLVAHMYDYQPLFEVILDSSAMPWVELTVIDISNKYFSSTLFESHPRSQAVNIDSNSALNRTKLIEIGGRKWQLNYQPTQQFMQTYSNWTLYWLMTSALVILSLMSILLLMITGRIQQVKQEVSEKTREVKASENKFRRLVEGVKGEYILYAHDRAGIFTYVSPSVEDILGYSEQEFLTHYATFMTDSPINKQVADYTHRVLEGKHVFNYELEIFHKNGSKHILKITENATRDDYGHIIGVEGIAHDITRSKYEHMQLEKLSLAVKNSPIAVIIMDRDGVIEYVNPKFTEIGGYSALEVIGEKPRILETDIRGDEIYESCLQAVLKGEKWQGEVQKRKKSGEMYWSSEYICPLFNDEGEVTHFIATQEDVTQAKQMREEKSYQASHDALTGLINRREFELRLERVINSAKNNNTEHALCFMDLDRFKIVNDTCGHVAGDELLRQVGDLLYANIRQRDTLARLGGDEFVLLIEHCDIEQAYDSCQKIINLLTDFRFHWQEHTFSIGITIGVALIDRHIQDRQDIMSRVDAACYLAKDEGRNRVKVHTEDSERLKQRKGEIKWSNEINSALDTDRFLLYVQPIIPLQEGHSCLCYEVLLRLKMPDGTIVPPNAFLPAAERYNLAVKIDRWVVEHVLSWMRRHAKQLDNITAISINLSGQSLGDEGILDFIMNEFQYGAIAADKVTFEITETAAIANLREATHFMKCLSEIGCHFSLDDFGSGLSSFAYLKNLNVDALKIDGMFVKDMLDDPIDFEMVKSIHGIGHVMGLKTIAEFVENEEIADKLRDIGVDYAQGFALGKPVPIESLFDNA